MKRVFDAWFALLPFWAIPLTSYLVLNDLRPDPIPFYELNGVIIFLVFLGLFCLQMSAFACCWRMDRTMQGAEKVRWYAITLLLVPVGSTLCYFLRLREGLFPGTQVVK